jgi:hypothetical protein
MHICRIPKFSCDNLLIKTNKTRRRAQVNGKMVDNTFCTEHVQPKAWSGGWLEQTSERHIP